MDELNPSGTTQLSLLDEDIMRRTAKWARFLAIVGFVMIYRNSGAPTQTVAAGEVPHEKGKRRG